MKRLPYEGSTLLTLHRLLHTPRYDYTSQKEQTQTILAHVELSRNYLLHYYSKDVLPEVAVLGTVALEGGIVGSINRIKMDYQMTFARAFLPAGSTVVTC